MANEKAVALTTANGQSEALHKVNGIHANGKIPFRFSSGIIDVLEDATLLKDNDGKELHEMPADFEKNVYIPTWDNRPADVKAIISLHGSPILTFQNTSAIIAAPGMGKSSLVEAIAASCLNREADALGFSVSEDCEHILIIDNERTSHDVWGSFYRMCKRAGIHYGDAIEKVTIAGLRSVPRLKERMAVIEYLIQQKKPSLLVLDGAGDLVTDTNDLLQAIDCRIWLREMTVKYSLSIFTTLHPNPNTNKPRGHIGSEVHRECECVLTAKSIDGNTRIITSDFEFGKNRNYAHVSSAYRWSDEEKMFVATDIDSIAEVKETAKNNRQRKDIELLQLKVLPTLKALTRTELETAVMDYEDCKDSTAKRRVNKMIEFNLIKRHEDGRYRAIA